MTTESQGIRTRPPMHAADFEIGEFVYLRTDPDQRRRMVTGILVRPEGYQYFVSMAAEHEMQYYGIELSREPDEAFRVSSPG